MLAEMRAEAAALVGPGDWVRVGSDPGAVGGAEAVTSDDDPSTADRPAYWTESWGYTAAASDRDLRLAAAAVNRVGRDRGFSDAIRYVDRPGELQMVADAPDGLRYEFGGARRMSLWAEWSPPAPADDVEAR